MINIDKLLVLKAFYLGYEIRENHFNEAEALKLVNRAIGYYSSLNKPLSKPESKRRLFYLLIKCELLRHETTVENLRADAQELAKSIKSKEMYLDYMKIIEATILIHRSPDIVRRSEYKGKTSLFNSPAWYVDTEDDGFANNMSPFAAINVSESMLTSKQVKFLYKIPLIEIMKKHNIL